jgi:antitoxin component YwqK of YwqJK toxin-antitoxin module
VDVDRDQPRDRDIEAYPDTSDCDGKLVETIEDFYEDGTLKLRREVVHLEDGSYIAHGTTTTFWEFGGEKKLEMQFVCGVRHGPKHAWHIGGSKWQEGAYLNGRDHGTWTVWGLEGNKIEEFTLDRGAWNGKHTRWYENGQKMVEVEWVNGVKQGPEIYWDEFGTEVRRIEFVDGVAQPTAGPASQ